jgi:hypothetical protein
MKMQIQSTPKRDFTLIQIFRDINHGYDLSPDLPY